MKTQHSGFTLIELLVVVSIISLIASIALASLTQARTKAINARISSQLLQLKIAAELYYDEQGNYGKFCEDIQINPIAAPIYNDLQDITHWLIHCANGWDEWAAAAYLVSDPIRSSYFCVDSSGHAKTIQGTFSSNDSWAECP